jgi:site-specific DNA-methyltransferase (adenine-specific)
MPDDIVLLQGDSLLLLKDMLDNSIDSVVTDPPYELGFMGKSWDSTGIANSVELWKEVLRVLKPGGYLLSFGGSRTYHRMACAIEDAGFEIRDQIMWVYGSGFPKSMDISKAIDKAAGAERKVISEVRTNSGGMAHISKTNAEHGYRPAAYNGHSQDDESKNIIQKTEPSTEAAKQWSGWGTALKPAHEPIVMARKPFKGTVAANVLSHGVGGLNIDDCRVELNGGYKSKANGRPSQTGLPDGYDPSTANQPDSVGRWPANLIHDGSDEVIAAFPNAKGQQGDLKNHTSDRESLNGIFGKMAAAADHPKRVETDKSAARFFYCAKTSKADRNEGLEGRAEKQYSHDGRVLPIDNGFQRNSSRSSNNHPTVKPTELMKYLCRLVTPPGGTVLDPFTGSGSTGKAAVSEGFKFIGIELEYDYVEIAAARIHQALIDSLC